MVKKRRRHSGAYKFRITLETLEGSKTISQLSSEHEVQPYMIRAWKRQLLEDGPSVLASNGERKQGEQEAQEAELYVQNRRLKMILEGIDGEWSIWQSRRRTYIDREDYLDSPTSPSRVE